VEEAVVVLRGFHLADLVLQDKVMLAAKDKLQDRQAVVVEALVQ
jgi:hypothetical protein